MRIQKSCRPPGVEAPERVESTEGEAVGVPATANGTQEAVLRVECIVEPPTGEGDASAVAAETVAMAVIKSSKRVKPSSAALASTSPKVTESARLSLRLLTGSFSAGFGLHDGEASLSA